VQDDVDVSIHFSSEIIATNSTSDWFNVVDVDGDGDLDILASLGTGSGILLNDGTGTFESVLDIGQPYSPVGDLDGDGDADRFIVFSSSNVFWLENMDGLWTAVSDRHITDYIGVNQKNFATVDIDQDGDLDGAFTVATPDRCLNTIYFQNNTSIGGGFLVNHQPGPCGTQSVDPEGSQLEFADLNNDGHLDLIETVSSICDTGAPCIKQILWFPGGAFSSDPPEIIGSYSQSTVIGDPVAGDINGDGQIDLMFAEAGFWIENLGNGSSWGAQQNVSVPPKVLLRDLDADGDLDALVAGSPTDPWSWSENIDGNGTFVPGTSYVTTGFIGHDFDGDGFLDGLYLDNQNQVHLLRNLRDDCNLNGTPDACESAAVALACIDRDADGLNADQDCDDANPRCKSDCTDLDQDGFCFPFDCDDTNEHCTGYCGDNDSDGVCNAADCDDNDAACTVGSCDDPDLDGLRNCEDPCPEDVDLDGDGVSLFGNCPAGPVDCDDSDPWCSTSCVDADLDGYCAETDCDDTDDTDLANFPETNDGIDNNCSTDPGYGLIDEILPTTGFLYSNSQYVWTAQPEAFSYRALRADSADFLNGCVSFNVTQFPYILDFTVPAPGDVYYYVVQAYTPHTGDWGKSSSGSVRDPLCD